MTVIAVRTVIIYLLLIIAMRLMGRRQLGDLQPTELVVTLLIADVAAVPMQDSGIPLLYGLIPVLILIALEILLSALMLKSSKLSALISGNPLVLISNGKLNQRVMKKLRLSVEDLMESLRQQSIFDVDDIHTAIAETNGSITVFPKVAARPVTVADVRRPPDEAGMPLLVLADGRFCDWALTVCGLTQAAVREELSRRGCKAEDIMLMTADQAGHFTVVPREIHT